MSAITVIGGTGYAGSAIVAEAAARGYQVTALSTKPPTEPVENVNYVEGDAGDEGTLARVIAGSEVVVAALAPRGPLAAKFRDIYRTIARLADAEGARLFVVGGFSSLRPTAGAPRFVSDISHVPVEVQEEVLQGAALITDDLPATPESLDWVFVSPALKFGAFAPGERLGHYRVGGEVALDPKGGSISGADYALGFVDLIEQADRHRAHVGLAY